MRKQKIQFSKKQVLKDIGLFSVLLFSKFNAYSDELELGYDSRYVSEGRNNIDQGGIAWLQLNHHLDDSISLFGVYGAGDNYDELNLGLVYSQTFHGINYYLSVTRLEFFVDKSSDNELGFGLSYSPIEQFSLSVDAVYSTEADGTFVEFSFLYGISFNHFLTFNP